MQTEHEIETGMSGGRDVPVRAESGDPAGPQPDARRVDRIDPVWLGFRAADAGISLKVKADSRAAVALVVLLVFATFVVVAVIAGASNLLVDLAAVAGEGG